MMNETWKKQVLPEGSDLRGINRTGSVLSVSLPPREALPVSAHETLHPQKARQPSSGRSSESECPQNQAGPAGPARLAWSLWPVKVAKQRRTSKERPHTVSQAVRAHAFLTPVPSGVSSEASQLLRASPTVWRSGWTGTGPQ